MSSLQADNLVLDARNTVPSDCGNRPTIIIACHAWFGDTVGGSFKFATEQAIDLAKRGFRVCYVCSVTADEEITPVRHEQGVEIWGYPRPTSKSPSFSNINTHIRESQRITSEICETTHVVAVCGHTPLQFRGAEIATRKSECPQRIYHVHSPFPDELKAQWDPESLTWKQRAGLLVAKRIERSNLKRATLVQCFSKFSKSLLENLVGATTARKICVSPGWVDCNAFRSDLDREAARARMPEAWQTDGPVFFTLRRIEPRMGIDTLVEAVAKIARNDRELRVVIGGTGSQRQELIELVNQRGLQDVIHFAGRLSDEEVQLAYIAADCFVLPTRALECFGIIILESWASNTPVIASRAGAIPELVEQQGEGWLFDASNENQLAERMESFLAGHLTPREELCELAAKYDVQVGLDRLFNECLITGKVM